jgi:ABC-type sugar transport system ATPase subunit
MSTKLALNQLRRSFPGVQALDGVSFELRPGEVHALVGENGAGKSTLIKIIAGALRPDSGEMILDGRPYRPQSPREASEAGIATIYQELNWLPSRNAAFNILMGREPVRWGGALDFAEMRRRTQEVLHRLRADTLPLDRPAEMLKAGQKQILEIARALVRESSVLIMDEPTAALNQDEQEALFSVVRTLRESGMTLLYVSHRLEEIFRLADRVTVLRDGRHVRTTAAQETTRDRLITDMIGREWTGIFPTRNPALGEVLLKAEGLAYRGAFHDVAFILRAGQVLGITGLAGSGTEELGRALFGAIPIHAGTLRVAGSTFTARSPSDAIRRRIAYIPDDRKTEGVIQPLSVRRNIALPLLSQLSTWFGMIRGAEESALASRWVKRLDIKTPGLGQLCQNLSGGNQQKVALAKWLASEARVLILAEPTQGIDVGVKFELYRLIGELSSQGVGVILISSEIPELLGLSHSILVMRDGEMVAQLDGSTTDRETVLRWSLGHPALQESASRLPQESTGGHG